jgi:hypothetical protein
MLRMKFTPVPARPSAAPEAGIAPERKGLPSRVGESLVYDIRMGKIKVGTASYRQLESVWIDGVPVQVMEFNTNLARFKDKELIYCDPQTRLPLKVERDILNFLVREAITEVYDQKAFTVKISKRAYGRTSETVIQKDKPLQNSILLPHYVRDVPVVETGMTFTADLPTRSVDIKLVAVEDVEVPAGVFKAYHFVSDPRQIEIWISADDKKIPLKIQGIGVFGYTMLLREYSAGEKRRVL